MCNNLMSKSTACLKKNKKTNKLQMHDFFRYLIKKNVSIKPTYVDGKYMEIDTYNDFTNSKKDVFNEK